MNQNKKKNTYITTNWSSSHNMSFGRSSVEKVTNVDEILDSEDTEIDNTLSEMKQKNSHVDLPNANEVISDFTLPSNVSNVSSISNENRLANYFVDNAQNDTFKQFFELSQSQNHYRQDLDKSVSSDEETKTDLKTFQTDSGRIDNSCINLINDLTSFNNFEYAPSNKIVRTVNYFSIEYDNFKLNQIGGSQCDNVNENNRTNECIKLEHSNGTADKLNETLVEKNLSSVVENCQYCYNFAFNNFNFDSLGGSNNKYKKAMDDKSSPTSKENQSGSSENKILGMTNVALDKNYPEQQTKDYIATITEGRSSGEYTPVKHHWFYRVEVEGKSLWRGFSVGDSKALEEAFNRPDLDENTVVATDGGRYDVNIVSRLRTAVYWKDKPTNVRRCSWFYKGDVRYVPYTESVAEKLEELYRLCASTGEWHRRLSLPHGELVMLHSPGVMVHLLHAAATENYVAPNQSTTRPKVVRRGCEESEIEDTEPSRIDHLLLLCHGVGSACDMRFRSVEEVVDDFRATSLQLIQSHYKNSYDEGLVGRVEVLPISWHSTLHSGATGVDARLAQITLESIPRLRNFTNDTVLDVLFYTSPVYSQTIIDTVCSELNRIYELFKKRNPAFRGGVSLGGHSLGSVILYDLLCNQQSSSETGGSSDKSYVAASAGVGRPSIQYPRLVFEPDAMYGLGSPIAIFECIRGVEALGAQFRLPTCRRFFNIFHPYDPIAYRIEPLINCCLKDLKPTLIPHHKGRKRMHLELKDTMVRVGADIKARFMESVKTAWFSMWRTPPPPAGQLEKVVEEEIEKDTLTDETKEETPQPTTELLEGQLPPGALGRLNEGRRVDYVLQEAPFEMINEYLFAMSSHVCYWESEDTMLLMLREIYDGVGVRPDGSVPQNSMTIQRTRTPTPDEMEKAGYTGNPSTSK